MLRVCVIDISQHRIQRRGSIAPIVLDPSPEVTDGRVVFGAADPAVGVLDRSGHALWQHTPEILNYRRPAGLVSLSLDGAIAQFRFLASSQQRLGRFDLTRRQMSLNVSTDSALTTPRTTGLDIKDWDCTTHPTLDGKALPLDQYERSRSLAISAKEDRFLLGSEWHLRFFDNTGQLGWQTDTPEVPWAVNLTPDGQYAVSALGDGTIRWYRTTQRPGSHGPFRRPRRQTLDSLDPRRLLRFLRKRRLPHRLPPQPRPRSRRRFVQVDQLKKLFYRPDLLAQRLKPDSDKLFSKALNQIGDVSAALHSGSPPELALLSPPQGVSDNGQFTLQFKVTDRGDGLIQVSALADRVEKRVPEITRDQQFPMRLIKGQNFPIAKKQ